jgi:hypothetical protein
LPCWRTCVSSAEESEVFIISNNTSYVLVIRWNSIDDISTNIWPINWLIWNQNILSSFCFDCYSQEVVPRALHIKLFCGSCWKLGVWLICFELLTYSIFYISSNFTCYYSCWFSRNLSIYSNLPCDLLGSHSFSSDIISYSVIW